jgi:AcrR family transcriptional regulator
MTVEDRRSMIIDAVIPLLLEHGTTVTSRQISEAAGVAEGTVFRAFGDKETLINAAIERYFDPEKLRGKLRGIDPDDPLEVKVRCVFELLQERFSGVFRMMAVLGQTSRPPVRPGVRYEYAEIIARALEPDAERLNVPPSSVGALLRLVAFSSTLPPFNDGQHLSTEELTHFVLYGIAGTVTPKA